MFKKVAVLVAVMSLGGLTVLPAQASDATAVGLKVGTLGYGIEGVRALSDTVNLRFGYNAYNWSKTKTSGGVSYDGTLKLESFDVLADWHPFGNGFRFTGGVMYDNNKFDVSGQPSSGAYTINGHTYSAAEVGSLNGSINWNNAAPYIGIGYGDAVAAGSPWTFMVDVGALYQGSASVSLTATNPTHNASLTSDVSASQSTLQSDLNSYKWYPVASIGVEYRF
ncbi:MAG: hypothetical protein M0T84_07075 [Betaproteobacteria bacterium]|nr:hypothetical protein [Betaproteobacteria bacterium]